MRDVFAGLVLTGSLLLGILSSCGGFRSRNSLSENAVLWQSRSEDSLAIWQHAQTRSWLALDSHGMIALLQGAAFAERDASGAWRLSADTLSLRATGFSRQEQGGSQLSRAYGQRSTNAELLEKQSSEEESKEVKVPANPLRWLWGIGVVILFLFFFRTKRFWHRN